MAVSFIGGGNEYTSYLFCLNHYSFKDRNPTLYPPLFQLYILALPFGKF